MNCHANHAQRLRGNHRRVGGIQERAWLYMRSSITTTCWGMHGLKRAYQNWLLMVLSGVLMTFVSLFGAHLISRAFGSVAYSAYVVAIQMLNILYVGIFVLALVVAMNVRRNAGRIGTIVLLAFTVLFSIIYMATDGMIERLYSFDAEFMCMGRKYTRMIGVAIMIASAVTYLLYLATKNSPWFVPLIITAVASIVAIFVGYLLLYSMDNQQLVALYAVMHPAVDLMVALRIVHTESPAEEGRMKQQTEEQTAANGKSKAVSALLAFFLGALGVHRYYLGYIKKGIIQTCGYVSLIIGYILYAFAMQDNSAGLLFVSAFFLLYGGAVGVWAFVDFIRILTGGLAPVNGSGYANKRPPQVQAEQAEQTEQVVQADQAVQAASASTDNIDSIDALEKLARIYEQGILTDEEFQQKKAELLAKI